jgi:hypothetical protein
VVPRQENLPELPELPFSLPNVAEADTTQELVDLRASRRPFVIRRALEHWPLHRELTAANSDEERFDWLATMLAPNRLHWTEGPWDRGITPDGVSEYGSAHREFVKREGSSAEFVAALRRRPSHTTYLKSVSLTLTPRLGAKLGHIECLAGAHVDRTRLWIGSGGHVSNLHYDPFNNLIGVATGIKRVVMFPLAAIADLYPTALDRGLGARPASWVTLLAWDRARFPRLEQALQAGVQAIVGPGDALWMPPFWWHHVESFGLNVMVNSWCFDVPPRILAELERALIGAMRAVHHQRDDVRARWLAKTERALARIGEPTTRRDWEANQRTLFDHWVAAANGDPIATVPGEYQRMIERLNPAWWPWFRARVREAAARWTERDYARILTRRPPVFPGE